MSGRNQPGLAPIPGSNRRAGVLGRLLATLWLCMAGIAAAQPGEAATHDAPGSAQPLAHAPEAPGDAASSDRSQAFVAVEGAAQEEVAGGPLLLGAYGLVWMFLLAYVIVLARRTARTEQEVARLADLLRQHPG